MPLPDDVELLDGGTAGADLLDAISERDKLIVVDALDADLPPGAIVRMMPGDLATGTSGSMSLHEFGIAETLLMARQLNCGPRQVTIIGIKPHDTRCGIGLTAQMTQWLPRVIEAVFDELGV